MNGLLALLYFAATCTYLFGIAHLGALGASAFIFAISGQIAFCTCALRPWKIDTLTKVIPLGIALWLEANEPDDDASAWAW